MRDVFPGYYKPTKDEMDELWSNATIVLDTNALFNLFRYTDATRAAFLNVLSAKKDRLWLPHQVGLEFQRGRLGVIEDQAKAFTDLIVKAKAALGTVTKDVGTLRNHPTLDLDELRSTVNEAIAAIEQKIEPTREKYESEVLAAARHDSTTDTITELYAGRVGSPYAQDAIAAHFKTGQARYEARTPPGYKDGHKPEPDRYGDLILWFQLLDKAEAEGSAVIFVGDDQKEDWWREFKGRKIGPRVELVDEFQERTGKRIYFLTPQGLMALAKQYDDAITKDTVQEVAEVSEAQARLHSALKQSDRKKRHFKEHDYKSMSTVALENLTQQLGARQVLLDNAVRDGLGIVRKLEAQGNTELAESLLADVNLSAGRRDVIVNNDRLKAAEFELMGRRRPEFLGRSRPSQSHREYLHMTRRMLARQGVPVLTGDDSWLDVSEADLLEVIAFAEEGNAPEELTIALDMFHHAESRWGEQYGKRREEDSVRLADD